MGAGTGYPELEGQPLDVYVFGPQTVGRFDVAGLEAYAAAEQPTALPPHSFFIFGAMAPPSPALIAMGVHAVGDTWDGAHGRLRVVSYRADQRRVIPHRGWEFDLSQDWDPLFWEDENSPTGDDDVLVLAEALGVVIYEQVETRTVAVPKALSHDTLHLLP